MKCCEKEIKIPAWISCRTYLFGKKESRTYISNEKRHSYILLEGLASDMYSLVVGGDEEAFRNWVIQNAVADQIEAFLGELAEQELISFEKQASNKVEEKLFKPMHNEDNNEEAKFIEEMQEWLYNNKFMFSLFVELTYKCNLLCVHCYNPKNMSEKEINYDLCKKAIDDAYELGCFRITFSGGEATLHSRFYELVSYARSKHMSVEIFTNGQVLATDEKLYKNLLDLYPYRICISLYSTTKVMHERVTAVKGSFEKTNGLLRRLINDNVNVQIKNFLLNFNCMDCISVKNLAKRIGATSVADISLIPTIEGDKKTMQYELNDDELFELYINPDSPLYLCDRNNKFEYEKIKDSSPCLGGFTGLCINPVGDVVICVSLPLSVGNLYKESLKTIWQDAMNKKQSSLLYKWLQVRISDCTECYKKEYCEYCNYCPGMGYLENGYLKHSDVLCKQAKVKMRAYKYLLNNK